MGRNWDDHRFCLAIARERTLTAAARALGVSQPTVSRRLEAMEARLKVRLFDRTREGYALTSQGTELFEAACRVEEELAEVDRRLFGGDQTLTGGLRITCTDIFLNGYLGPAVWRFLGENPGIDLSLTCTRSRLSLSRGDADIAIRFTQDPPETLAGRRLGTAAYAVYAARAAVGDHFSVENRDEWDWIGLLDDMDNRTLFGPATPNGRLKHRVDSMTAMQSMARAGLGVALLPCYIADRDPTLRRAMPEPMLDNRFDIWILYHPEIRRVYRVRLFADFVADLIKSDLDLFEGRRPI